MRVCVYVVCVYECVCMRVCVFVCVRASVEPQEGFNTYVDKFYAHITATGAACVLLAAWGYKR
jgi:hypothetical protein